MNPVPNEQNIYSKEVEEFLAKGGKIQHFKFGERSEEIDFKGGFYGRKKKKDTEADKE